MSSPSLNERRHSRRRIVGFLSALALVPAVTVVAILAVPDTLQVPDAWLLLVAVAGLVAVYAATGVALLRRPSAADLPGVRIGLLAGALWSIEIFAGGPAPLSYGWEQAVGGACVAAATLVTLAAGPLARSRGGAPRDGAQAGALAGLVSGIVVFVFATAMTLLTLHTLGGRSDYRRQSAASGAPTMHAFLVSDILTAGTSHLVINLVLGLIGAGAASVVIAGRRAAGRSLLRLGR